MRYWINWFKGAQTYLGREDAKGLYFPPGNYPFEIDEMLELKDGQIIMGAGWESRIFRDRPRGERKPKDKTKPKGEKEWVWDIPQETWRPMFRTNGKDICIRNLSLDSGGTSADGGENGEARSLFERINGFQSHENWLQNMLCAASLKGERPLHKKR